MLKQKLINSYIALHELFYNNIGTIIYYLVKDNKYISIKNRYQRILRFFPFFLTKLIIHLFNYHIIYQKENLFYISKNKVNHIVPVIFKFNINEENYKEQFKLFNVSIPFYVFQKIYNLNDEDKLSITYFKKGQKIDKEFKMGDLSNLKIYEIF